MEVTYYNNKIEKEIFSLGMPASAKVYKAIGLLVTFGNQLFMPYSKQLSRNLFELRIRDRRELRILYCFHQNRAVIVHFFIKKSQKTPRKEIDLAINRIHYLTNK